MLFKDDVVLALRPQMAQALPAIDKANKDTVGREAIVTSGTDGVHGHDSLHYVGLAIDIRTRDLTKKQTEWLAAKLREVLGKNFDVVIEKDHIHIEYDPE